jgi:hypothetical protein
MPQYDLIDFAVVLIGYILSGEPTLLAFYERLARLRLILHGAFWPEPLASSLNSVSVSGCSRSRKSGGASDALSRSDWLARKPFPSAFRLV